MTQEQAEDTLAKFIHLEANDGMLLTHVKVYDGQEYEVYATDERTCRTQLLWPQFAPKTGTATVVAAAAEIEVEE